LPTIQRSSLPAIRRGRSVVLLTFLLIALGFTPLYAQNITLVNIDPSTASPNTPISMTASGFTVGLPAPSVSVMLAPQGGGAPITVASAVTGTGVGRSINFFAPSSAAGVYTVTASGAGLTFINSLSLTLTGPPSLTLAPNSGAQSANVLVTIVGSNTSFPSGATTANFGPGISVGGAAAGATGPLAVQPNGTAIASLAISPGASIGTRNVTVNGADTITVPNAFSVTSGTRTLTLINVDPATGVVNTPVSVTAAGFQVGVLASAFTVTLSPQGGGAPIHTIAVVTGTAVGRSINFIVPPGAPAGAYTLTASGTGYVSGNSLPFTITGPPSFTLNPNTGAQSATVQVTIAGSNTTFPLGATTANFGAGISVGGAPEGANGPVAVQANGTAIATLIINPSATIGARAVTVNGTDTLSLPNAFIVTSGPRILTLINVDPNPAAVGSPVSVTATGFEVGVAAPPFTITLTPQGGGAPITTSATVTGTATGRPISFIVPPGSASGLYTLTAAGAGYISINSLPFTIGAPSFTLSPTSAPQGVTIQVTISGSNTTFPPGATTANFGAGISVGGGAEGANGPIAVQPNGTAIATLVINSSAALGPRSVTVAGVGTLTQANAFTVITGTRTLTLDSIFPPSGVAGAGVTVTATGFEIGVTAPALTVTLTPQGGGAPVNVPGSTTGTTLTRQITFTVPVGSAGGTYNVTVAGAGYVSSNSLPFTVTAPQITSVSPASAPQGQTLSATITGANTNFTSLSTVSFGAGITVNGVVFNSPASLTANISVQLGAAPGARDVTVTTNGTPVIGSGLFSVIEVPGEITSIAPRIGQQGASLVVTITGSHTNFGAGSSVSFGPGITVTSINAGSATSLTATINIASGAAVGPRDVTVTTNAIPVTKVAGFSVTPGTPKILSVAPPSAPQGQTISLTIIGENAGFALSSSVSLGSGITVNSVTANTADNLTTNVTVAPNATPGVRDVVVTTNGSPVTGSGLFTVIEAPPQQIISVNPPTGEQGKTVVVTIAGANTNFTSSSTASFGQGVTVNSVVANGTFSITANITIAPNALLGARDVTVTTDGSSVTGANLFTIVEPPRLTSAFPSSAHPGDSLTVTITGAGTNFNAGSTVSFGSGITVNSAAASTATSLTANITITPGAVIGSRDVTVTTNGIPLTGTGLFAVTPAPRLVSVTPNVVTQGQTATLTITGEFTHFQQGVTQVNLGQGITIGSVTVNSTTSITVVVTATSDAAPGSRTLTVTTGVEQSALGAAVTVATPGSALTLIDPNSGRQGQSLSVRIVGATTNFSQAVTQVSFGAGITVNSVTVTNATTLTAAITIAADAVLGSRTVTVTTGAEVAALSNGFVVLPPGQAQPLTCITNAGVPPLLRAEGLTELTGDLLIVCTGGSVGQTSAVNVQLFLNTPITSRLVDGKSEALLIVDELGFNASSGATTPAVYRAVPAQVENAIAWTNVQITAPGPSGQRVLRITNVRANAATLGTSTSLVPTQVIAFLSISPSNSLPLSSPQQVVGYIQPGLVFDVTNCNATASGTTGQFVQCVGENAASPRDLIAGTEGNLQFALRFKEGFQTSFKTQIAAGQNPSTPGVVYNSESGFLHTPDLPYEVGGATTGTRLVARFANIPPGARIFVTTGPSLGSTAGLGATLVAGAATGSTVNLFCPLAANDGFPGTEIQLVNGSGSAAWEITAANPAAIESALFGVAVAFAPNTPNRLPGLGLASVSGSFAPFYPAGSDAGRTSASLPIPRFIDSAAMVNAFRIDSCVTNLLFPFVTNQAGFDTGIAVANTSRDPFGNVLRPQSGACTINYYGSTPQGGAAPAPQKSSTPIEAGSTMAFVLSSGGSHGISPAPGFQGYLVIQCDFRYGHGFAFITDGPIGSARVAEGYLGLVLDAGIAARASSSESLVH
jgi:hypothetical protein